MTLQFTLQCYSDGCECLSLLRMVLVLVVTVGSTHLETTLCLVAAVGTAQDATTCSATQYIILHVQLA